VASSFDAPHVYTDAEKSANGLRPDALGTPVTRFYALLLYRNPESADDSAVHVPVVSLDRVYGHERAISENVHGSLLMDVGA
jgi:hypothetical protein